MKIKIIIFIHLLISISIFGEDFKFQRFKSIDNPINSNIEKYLIEKNYTKRIWYFDYKNNKDGKWELFPFIKFNDNKYAVNVTTIFSKDNSYNYLLLIEYNDEIKILNTFGPFYDSNINEIAIEDINNDSIEEIIIKYNGEYFNGISIFETIQNTYKNIFNLKGDKYPEIVDLNDDKIYEIITYDILGTNECGDFWLFKVPPPIWNDYYEYNNNQYKICNSKYKKFLEPNMTLYEQIIDSLIFTPEMDFEGSNEIIESTKQELNDWITKIKNL